MSDPTRQLLCALEEYLRQAFPAEPEVSSLRVEAIRPQGLSLRLAAHERTLRPGQTISGPTLMKLADTAAYLALVDRDETWKHAVTSSLTIHFLRRAALAELEAVATVLKAGRALAVLQVDV